MDHTVVIPPDAQLDPLLRAYDRAVAAKHRQFLVGILCMAAAFALACIGAEINPALFWEKLVISPATSIAWLIWIPGPWF